LLSVSTCATTVREERAEAERELREMQGTVREERGQVMKEAAVRERELEQQVSALRASSSVGRCRLTAA